MASNPIRFASALVLKPMPLRADGGVGTAVPFARDAAHALPVIETP